MIKAPQAQYLTLIALLASEVGADPDKAVRRAIRRLSRQTCSPGDRKTYRLLSAHPRVADVVVETWEEELAKRTQKV